MAVMEKGDPVMNFTGYPAKMKEFLSANPGLSTRIKQIHRITQPFLKMESGRVVIDMKEKLVLLTPSKKKQQRRSRISIMEGLFKIL